MNQTKAVVKADWFYELTTIGMEKSFAWLASLRGYVDKVVDFGCWSGCEPLALLWSLDATEIVVVEKEQENLKKFEEELEMVEKKKANSLAGRKIQVIIADMTSKISELPDNYFDLAYCDNVLYYMQDNSQTVQNAIDEMARVTKSGGFVVSVEPKFQAKFENREHPFFKTTWPVRVSEPEDMSSFFEAAGLLRITVESAPDFSYCYRKP